MAPRPLDPSARGRTYSDKDLANAAARAGFAGDDVMIAVAVALAESGGRADVVSVTGDYGPWQINNPAHPELFGANAWWDLGTNAAMARKVFTQAGNTWRPWSTYNSGKWQLYKGRGAAALIGMTLGPNIIPGDPLGSIGATVGDGLSNAGQVATDATGAITQLGNAVKSIAGALFKAAAWTSSPDNWMRVGQVIVGGGLVIGALVVVTRPVTMKAAGLAAQVVTGGAGKAAGTAAKAAKATNAG